MNKIISYIKSNWFFLIVLAFLALVALKPGLKVRILRGLISLGLYQPDVSHLELKPVAVTKEASKTLMTPSVKLQSATGEEIDLSNTKGKVIFLNFWATWCSPCIAEMPSINNLKKELDQQEVLFVMADIDGHLDRSKAFMSRNGYQLPVYALTSSVPKALFSGTVPTTVIINKQGEIVFQHEGMADYNSKEMSQLLNQLAEE